MKSIRGSLVFLCLLVSVLSLITLSRDDSPVKRGRGTVVPGVREVTPEKSTDPASRNDPVGDSGSQNEQQSDPQQPDRQQGDSEKTIGQEANPDLELQIRVLDADGGITAAGTPTGFFTGEGDPLLSVTPVLTASVKRLIAGNYEEGGGSLKPESPATVDLPVFKGRWIADCTLQKRDSYLLKIDRMMLLRPQSAEQRPLLVVPAMTRAPAGSRLRVQVVGDQRTLDGGILKVDGPEMTWVLPMVPRQWYAGLLKVQFVWSWEAATDDRREQILDLRGAEFVGKDWVWNGVLSVDTAAEAKRQGEEIRRWYRRALEEVEMSRDLLLVAGAHARGKRARLVRDDDRYSRLLTYPLAGVLDDLGRGKGFAEKRWRQLLDEELPLRWKPWVEPQAIPWPDRYPGPARNIPLLFHTLAKYSRLESTVIYMALGKERHRNDFVADFDWDPATERTQTLGKLRNFIDAIREKLEELEKD